MIAHRTFVAPDGWQIDRGVRAPLKDAAGQWFLAVRARRDGETRMFVWRFDANNAYIDTMWENTVEDNGHPELALLPDGGLQVSVCNSDQTGVRLWRIPEFIGGTR